MLVCVVGVVDIVEIVVFCMNRVEESMTERLVRIEEASIDFVAVARTLSVCGDAVSRIQK